MNKITIDSSQIKEEHVLDEKVKKVLTDLKQFKSNFWQDNGSTTEKIQKEYSDFQEIRHKYEQLDEYIQWLRSGKPIPTPPIVKHEAIKLYAKIFCPKIFIETGTFLGDTINAVKDIFEKIYSIELSPELHKRAKQRFEQYPHITLLQGDSVETLNHVLGEVNEACLFWLDAHHSGGITAKGKYGQPITYEFDHILNHSVSIEDHVILVDDAGSTPWSSILRDKLFNQTSNCVFEMEHDILRIHRKL